MKLNSIKKAVLQSSVKSNYGKCRKCKKQLNNGAHWFDGHGPYCHIHNLELQFRVELEKW